MALGPNKSNSRVGNINNGDIRQLFVYVKPINIGAKRYRGFLFPDSLPTSMVPKEFFAFTTWFPKTVEEAVELCVNATVETLIDWINRNEKYGLKPEKKRPWSSKVTRDPVNDDARDLADKLTLFEMFLDLMSLAREYANTKPMEINRVGARPHYDRVAIGVIYAMKELGVKFSFESIRKWLMDQGVDIRVSDKAKYPVPSKSRLVELYGDKKIKEWLSGFLKWLNYGKAKPIVKQFGAMGEEYGIDGTGLTTEYLKVTVVGLKKTLKKTNYTVKFLVDLSTDMPVDVIVSDSHQVTGFLREVPENSTVYADAEFFTEANCETAIARHIDFQVKPKKNVKRGIANKEIREKFDSKRYKRRKLVERMAIPYSNASRMRTRFKRREAIEMLALTIALAKAYKRLKVLQAKQRLFKPIIKARSRAKTS